MLKQYFYITFLLYFISNIILITVAEPYATSDKPNKSNTTSETSNSSLILTEDGGKVSVEPVNNHQSREHIKVQSSSSLLSTPSTSIEKTSVKNVTVTPPIAVKISNKSVNTSITNSVLNKNVTDVIINSTTTNVTSTTEIIKPVSENVEINGDSKVKPRKGVTFGDMPSTPSILNTTLINKVENVTKVSTTSTTTTKKPTTTSFVPRKPIVTIGSDEDAPVKPPPKLFINGKEVLPNNKTHTSPNVISEGEHVVISSRRTQKGPDYVLPIVLTILAVPLVAIILTVGYKRGSEWWQHRHYRRMDFLIDGMYNN